MKKYILCSLLMILAATIIAQDQVLPSPTHRKKKDQTGTSRKRDQTNSRRGEKDVPFNMGVDSTTIKLNKYNLFDVNKRSSQPIKNDSAYYGNVVKKHGWFVGVGKKLTRSEASHRSCYYKLSKKNQAGNWTYMEAMNGYGNPTTNHTIGTYLVHQNDEKDKSANSDWKEKLKTVCKWEFLADNSGENVILERALDEEGNIIFMYIPVRIGEREYTGSYVDGWGMPIFLRTDSMGNDAGYANIVHITRDEDGYEVLFSFMDRFGYWQKNKDGAYMTKKAYDSAGHQIYEASLNLVGDKMIDDFGNCGWEHHYYKDYNESYFFDQNEERIKMPISNRSMSDNVYGYRFYPDQYGRDTLVMYIDQHGNPDINELGVQKIKTIYNDHGLWTDRYWIGADGNLHEADSLYHIAQIHTEFTNDGQPIKTEYKDALGNYVNGPDGWCIELDSLNSRGICIHEIDYSYKNKGGVLIKKFEFTRDDNGNTIKKWYEENKMRVDSVDAKGRDIVFAWYDLKGNPIENDGLHTHKTIYNDKTNTEIEIWLNKEGKETIKGNKGRNYSRSICINDTINHILTTSQYVYQYKEEYLQNAFQKQMSEDGNTIVAQWDLTPYGEHARVGGWHNLHYSCNVNYTMYGDIRTMIGRNEFNEPSYLSELKRNGNVYYFLSRDSKGTDYYDENGEEITNMQTFKERLPKVFCIEVTDTAIAYPLGLRNGDIILSYGDWTISEDLRTNADYFYLETILQTQHEKKINILRHYPGIKDSEILHITLPSGRTSDLGFYPHKIYYTQKEKDRLLNTCSSSSFALSRNEIPMQDTVILVAVQLKGSLASAYQYHERYYNIKDAGVVLCAHEKWEKGKDTWVIGEPIKKWEKQDMFCIVSSNLYMSQDMSSYRRIYKLDSGTGGMRFVSLPVSMDLFKQVEQLYLSLPDDVFEEVTDTIHPEIILRSMSITKKQLFGKWTCDTEEQNVKYSIHLNLLKKGVAKMDIEVRMEGEVKPGVTLSMACLLKYPDFQWNIQGKKLLLELSNVTPDCKITKCDVISDDEKLRNELLGQIQENKVQLAEEIVKSLNLREIINNNCMKIQKITPTEFYVKEKEGLLFHKVKQP